MAKLKRKEYGIYTVGDENFFAGIVAAINSLKYHGYRGPVAVIDIGFEPWMVSYLAAFDNVTVLDIEPVRKDIRFVDVKSEESPVMKGWAYKAFSIVHYDLFENWTFIDADYFPLCNLEEELLPDIKRGHFISTEDGQNNWDQRHVEAIGVEPGIYMNINAGFISLSMEKYGSIVHEWRNLMTRYKPFDLWYGDQGALNAVLDKYGVEKTCRDKVLWNQTWLNERMAIENKCSLLKEDDRLFVQYEPLGARIMGWHGAGWHKLWHQIGIDHYRKNDEAERVKFYNESQGKSPRAIVDIFRHFMFLDTYNQRLAQEGHLLSTEHIHEKSIY
jgi:lipopolysaccharide biosynthesis glycosyltransferase